MKDFTSVKRDCFGFDCTGFSPSCRTLQELVCQHENCVFYKTTKQFNEEQEKYPNMYDLPKRKRLKV